MTTIEQDGNKPVLLGVCAEFARWADVDPVLARVTATLACLSLFPIAIPLYILAAIILRFGTRYRSGSPRC